MTLIAASDGSRIACGRPGCGAAIATVEQAGANGSGIVWRVVLSRRWLFRPDLEPPRWRRGSHNRSAWGDRHESEIPQGGPNELLPTMIECPRCRALQRIDTRG